MKGSGRLLEKRGYVLPWKLGLLWQVGSRAEKAQACLVHNEIVAGASVMGGGSKVVRVVEGLKYHKIQAVFCHQQGFGTVLN